MVRQRIDLNGMWNFRLDPKDEGKRKKWFAGNKAFPGKVKVPGCWQGQGYGGKEPSTDIPRGDGMYFGKLVFRSEYVGTGWYQKKFTIPPSWKAKVIYLVFEGIHPSAEVWINGRHAGKHTEGPLRYRLDISRYVRFNAPNRVVVRVFEENRFAAGLYNWFTWWSGIYRKVRLEATGSINIDDVFAEPDIDRKSALFHVLVTGLAAKYKMHRFETVVIIRDRKGKTVANGVSGFSLDKNKQARITLRLKLKDMHLWSTDDPYLYTAVIIVKGGGEVLDEQDVRFGMRKISTRGRKILLNNKPIFIRGYGDDCAYPYSGSPETDKEFLRKRLAAMKRYGFNYVRHHTHVPTHEYLELADELGMLVQVESRGGFFNERSIIRPFDSKKWEVLKVHWKNIIMQHRNHPSIVTWSMNNECYDIDPLLVKCLNELYDTAKELDGTRLVLNRGGSHDLNDGYGRTDFVERALGAASSSHIQENVKRTKYPLVIHEWGYITSFPDIRIKKKFTGAIQPFFIEFAQERAREHGLEQEMIKWADITQKYQVVLFKSMIEKARNVRNLAGYSFWTGMDTMWAVEGILDDFGDPKGASAREFRKYNSATVLLADMPPYIRTDTPVCRSESHEKVRTAWCGSLMNIGISISHYSDYSIENTALEWELTSGKDVLQKNECRISDVPGYRVTKLADIRFKLPELKGARKLDFRARMKAGNRTITNNWPVWVFPRPDYKQGNARISCHFSKHEATALKRIAKPYEAAGRSGRMDVMVTDTLSGKALDYLDDGGKVVLITQTELPAHPSDFWAIYCNILNYGVGQSHIRKHPAVNDFPHDGFFDFQFYRMVRAPRGHAPGVFNLEEWPIRIKPIIRGIDSYKRCRNRGYLFEVNVGKGRLLATSLYFMDHLGLPPQTDMPEAHYFFYCMLKYVLSDSFKPKSSVTLNQLKEVMKKRLE